MLNRRQALIASSSSMLALTAGCPRPTDNVPAPSSTQTRTDVPLRILLVGNAQQADTIERAWASVTEQTVEFKTLPLDRSSDQLLAESLVSEAKKSDLLICPLAMVSELVTHEAIVPLVGDELELAIGELFPALRNGAARYASEIYAMPITSPLPAIVSGEAVEETPADWGQYDELVQQWDGKSAEPTAPGWAGFMFLCRAVTQVDHWLFGRESFEPLVNEEPYHRVLEQMVQTYDRYESKQQTPEQIWQSIIAGKLKGGITFPTGGTQSEADIFVSDLPGKDEARKVLLDPYMSVIALSSNCRQTKSSKAFVRWLSGDDGSDAVRQQIAPMNPVRRSAVAAGQSSAYQYWLTRRLETPLTVPSLQILSASKYYAALDSQVTRCLSGKSKPDQALAEVAKQWQAITEKVGSSKQLRAWRRSQGMSA